MKVQVMLIIHPKMGNHEIMVMYILNIELQQWPFSMTTYGKIWDNEESLDFGVSEFLTIPKPHLWFEVQVPICKLSD